MTQQTRQWFGRLAHLARTSKTRLVQALSWVVIASLTLSALGPSNSVYAASPARVPQTRPNFPKTNPPPPTASKTVTTTAAASKTATATGTEIADTATSTASATARPSATVIGTSTASPTPVDTSTRT